MKRYRKRGKFTVKRKVATQNSFGAEIIRWEKVSFIKGGHIDKISGGMISKGGRIVETSTHKMFCSYADVRIDDHIICDGKEYKVNDVLNPMEANRNLEIELESVFKNDESIKTFYYGNAIAPAITEADVLAMNSCEIDKIIFDEDIDFVDEYFCFAYPAELGKATIRIDHNLDMSFTLTEVMVNGVNHYVYCSGQLLDGVRKIQIM